MGSQGAQSESSFPNHKGQAAKIVLTELSSFDTRTPSNSTEPICSAKRLLQFSDSSDDSRSTSLNENVGAAAKVVELQGLNTLLFGAIQALCQQPGNDPEASKDLSQLVAMASKVPPRDAATFDKYRQDLQNSCRRMASALPMSPNRASASMDLCEDPFAELAGRAPVKLMSPEGQAGRDSPFTASASKVIIPRNPSSSSRASSALSHVSSRRSSRMRTSPNPFEVANSSEVIEEGNEEEEVSVEEVVTPGGTCREVLVRQSFDYLIDNPECLFRDPARGKRTDMVPSMRSVPPELPDSMASKQQLADGAAPAGRKAASGQLTDADVAQAISDAGLAKPESPSTSGAAANPFATIRAVVTPAVPASRHARPPLHDEGAAAKAQGAAVRAISESDDLARPGKGVTEAPDLNRISDPSPHSSASGSVSGSPLGAARCAKGPARSQAPSEQPQVPHGGASGRVGALHAPQNGAHDVGRKPQGSPRDGEPEKAKSGCWCF